MSEKVDLPEITVTDLKARMDQGDTPVLVDVREHFERRIADLPGEGQIRIPTGEVLQRMEELQGHGEVVVYCRSGSRSAWAVRLLRERGLENVMNLKGGILAWAREVDPSVPTY